MRDYHITITPFEFLDIRSIIIEKEISSHASAVISGHISDERTSEYKQKLLEDAWVQVCAVGENGQSRTLMIGFVAGFSIDSIPHQKTLTIKIMSGSWLMDRCPHFRTFQDPAKSYADMMEIINQGYTDSDFICIDAARQPFGGLLLQYMETDWAFIRRISSLIGAPVTPESLRPGAKYYVGKPTRGNFSIPSGTPYTATKHVGVFMQRSSCGLGSLSERDYLEYQFKSREIFDLWDQIIIEDFSGFVCKIYSEYIGNELVHNYCLRSDRGLESIPEYNQQQAGCSFEATISEVKQDVVRVEVFDDENVGQSNTIWFPYSTVYSTPDGPGWYCMPEIGDHVRLHIPGEREWEALVSSAVHKGDSPDRQNPDHKSIKTIHGKELLMTPEKILLTNNKGMEIEINDQSGVRIISDKEILVQAAANITISSEDASLMIAGSSTVDLVQAGASVHLEDDIDFSGAKFRIH